MLGSQTLLDALFSDPLALYPALAALLLALVGVASGLLRGDLLALTRPWSVVVIVASVAGVWGLDVALAPLDPVWRSPAGDLALAPLFLIALAYGPTPALVALALTVAWVGLPEHGSVGRAPAQVWLLALQLTILGWLAIAPNVRRSWGVAGVYLIAAHVLTWSTAGLAWTAVRYGGVSLALLEREHGLRLEGLALLTVAVALLPPLLWRALFRGSPLAHASPDADASPSAYRSDAPAALQQGAPSAPEPAGEARRERSWQAHPAEHGDLSAWRRPPRERRFPNAGDLAGPPAFTRQADATPRDDAAG